MSRGSAGAVDSSLGQDLSVLRSAVDVFNAEHPTAQLNTVGVDGPTILQCLTQYSDATASNFSATKTATCTLGPYLRAMPAMPVGSYKGDATILVGTTPGTGPSGWLFTGADFKCNDPSTDLNAAGNPYNGY
jgi:hypothetical protein